MSLGFVCEISRILTFLHVLMPVPVAALSKAWVCGRSSAEIAGSNPAGTWVFVCCDCCVLSSKSVRRADHSSRGILPSVVCLSVIVNLR